LIGAVRPFKSIGSLQSWQDCAGAAGRFKADRARRAAVEAEATLTLSPSVDV
jgi:hypothetical protein